MLTFRTLHSCRNLQGITVFCSSPASGMLTFRTLHSEVPLVDFPSSRLRAAAVTSKDSLFCSASGMLTFRTLRSVRWLFSPAVGYSLQGITVLFRFRDVNLQDPSQSGSAGCFS